MNVSFRLRLIITALLASLVGLPANLAAQASYRVTDLGTLPEPPRTRYTAGYKINEAGTVMVLVQSGTASQGGNQRTFLWSDGVQTVIGPLPGGENVTGGRALNESGDVAGFSHTCSPSCGGHAFLWSKGRLVDIGTLGFAQSAAWALNGAADVVGVAFNGHAPVGVTARRAFLHSGGTTTDLGTLPGGTEAAAYAINDSRQIVGVASTTGLGGETLWHAVMWHNGAIIDMHTTGRDSLATKVNAAGQAIGALWTLDDQGISITAFRYSNGTMTNLGDFGGAGSTAHDINEAGHVVGMANSPFGQSHKAFLYTGGDLINLGTLGGRPDEASEARAINASGQIVGSSDDINSSRHAFLYTEGTMLDLNTLIPPGTGWVLSEALDINDAGQIVGWGLIGGQARAFRLDPIPE